ncbi:MAG TPA: peptidyl-prolyl cis-trans isomerase [Bacillota bacterium]|jgi:parvulin-like peptidyl-prolyl isomerase|nr:hypothetical protein [Bacillota bacterium]HOJ46804.1 peptidyl-prolyl cis-trans isomerase [Bacillota bacterium]
MSRKVVIAILVTLLVISVAGNIVLGYLWWEESQPEVVAVVGQDKITKDDLLDRLLTRNREAQLNTIVEQVLIEQEAKKLGVQVTENDVTRRLQEIKDSLGGEDLYRKFLTDYSISEADLRDSIRHNLTIEKIILFYISDIPETEVVAYYENNKDLFQTPEFRLVRHIFTIDESEAKKAYADLLRGEDFGTVAERYSLDPSTNKEGGLIGYLTRDDEWLGVTETAFQLGKGTFSAPMRSEYGWHLVYVEDIRPASNPDYSEIKDQVRQAYIDYLVDLYSADLIQTLKDNAEIIKINI